MKKRYVVTENEIWANVIAYNEDVLSEIPVLDLFLYVKKTIASGESVTISGLKDKFADSLCGWVDLNHPINTLVCEFVCRSLPHDVVEDLENEVDFEVVVLMNDGTYRTFESNQLDY